MATRKRAAPSRNGLTSQDYSDVNESEKTMWSKFIFCMAIAAMLMVAGCSAKPDVAKLRMLAEQGDAQAQYSLGQCYLRGDGVNKDFVAAYKWVLLAGPSVNEKVDNFRTTASMSMTPPQIAEAKSQARKWQQERDKKEQSRPTKG